MFDLSGKNALVTGSAKRLGRAVALGLAEQGCNVLVHYDKSEAEAEKVRAEIAARGVKCWLVRADFADSESCLKLMEEAVSLVGRLDVLVNSASVFSQGSIDKISIKDVEAELFTNTWAPFLLSRSFAEKTDSGRIVNILDTRIRGYDLNHFGYYLSKKTLETVTESLALKLAPGITVNAVAPGLILPPAGKDYSYLEKKKDTVPLRKVGSPLNVVEAVIFLLKNDYVTGQIIFVDGGKHLVQSIEGT